MSVYAPEYTKSERIRIALKLLAWTLPIFLGAKVWFFDWLAEFAKNANCYNYANINGVHFVFYGLFVFMPLSLAIVLFLVEGRRSIKVLKLGQNPLPNEKVFRPTKYKYGAAAKVQPLLLIFIIMFLTGLSVWGGFQAHKLTKAIKPCAINKSFNQIGVKNTPAG